MKVLTLIQPWASLVAAGEKRIETRSWRTSYRGPLLIHASAGFPGECRALCWRSPFAEALIRGGFNTPADLPRGAIVALTRLVDVVPTESFAGEDCTGLYPTISDTERAFGDYSPGRFAWKFGAGSTVRLSSPVPCKGSLGLWTLPPELEREIRLVEVAS